MVSPSLTCYLGFNGVGRKHEQKHDQVARLRTEFEDQWHMDERGIGGPIKYLVKLVEMHELVEWVREAVRTHMANGNVLDEMDAYHLSIKPNFVSSQYMQIKAYGNHYRVIGETNVNTMATYDCGVASVFQHAQGPGGVCALGPMQYVGILQDII